MHYVQDTPTDWFRARPTVSSIASRGAAAIVDRRALLTLHGMSRAWGAKSKRSTKMGLHVEGRDGQVWRNRQRKGFEAAQVMCIFRRL
jgi:hypothetical protein